jgi:DNA-binding IclR family transcriptional regulator
MMKDREIKLLEAISEDELATQASLSSRLGIAVGSVNWYIKRLISRGYLKATRMDRTRLRYNMTSEGLAVLRRRASQYMKDSLKIYQRLREEAKAVVHEMNVMGISRIYLDDSNEVTEIFRLTCIENGIRLETNPSRWVVKPNGKGYLLEDLSSQGERNADVPKQSF